MQIRNVFALGAIIAVALWLILTNVPVEQLRESRGSTGESVGDEWVFLVEQGFTTDIDRSSIDPSMILSGGPGKDGIPAINDPVFVSLAETTISDEVRGIFIDIDDTQRFYPYSILVWHEIVNDTVGETPITVSFCPLCDSGIVFDRRVDGETLRFGVSGFLFESNLLMYDTATESLWSQARLEALVGDYTGTTLAILPLQLVTLGEVREKYPDALVMSTDTGFPRDYTANPYAGYLDTEEAIFPVSVSDRRFPAKELLYVPTI